MSTTTFTVNRDNLEVVMERTFNAPRDAVFTALTDPDAIPKWWGLRSQTTTVDKEDARVGGAWRYVSRDSDGNEYAFHGTYKAVSRPARLSRTFNFEGVPGDHELLETLTLEDLGGKTRVRSTATYATVDDLDGMVASGMESGAIETWDRLAEFVEQPNREDLIVTRVFDAPVELAWKAWTEPEHVKQWWGPHGFTCPIARMDVRVGGTSLVCMSSPAYGDQYSTWHYQNIVPMQRIEYIHNLSDENGNKIDPTAMGLPADFPQDLRNLVSFKDLGGGKTEVTVTEYDWPIGQMMQLSRLGLEQCLDKMAASFAAAQA